MERVLTAKSIAQDALTQLANGVLRAGSEYLSSERNICTVCALGALFVARSGSVQLAHRRMLWNRGSSWIRSDLAPFFSTKQLLQIENCFEGYPPIKAERAFYKLYTNPAKRLAAILQNIIDHDGEFVLPADEWDWQYAKQPRLLLAPVALAQAPAYWIPFTLTARETVPVNGPVR